MVASLVLLVGLTALMAAASLTVLVEKGVTVNHRTSARALYAADAGVEVSRQFITGFARDKLDSLTAVWSGTGLIIPDPANLFPGAGVVLDNGSEPAFVCTTFVTFEDSTLGLDSQVYNYHYRTVSDGSHADGNRVVSSQGRLRVSATRGSFADYLIFTDTHETPDGSPIWFHTSGHFDGRVHTNDEYRFAYFPTFEDMVTSVHDKAWFYNAGSAIELDADRNGDADVPNFFGGFQRSAGRIDLPANSFSQQRAALGGNPSDTSPMSNEEIRTALGLAVGTTAPPDGVYVPASGGVVTGGIYIAGDATMVDLSVNGTKQVIRVKDSANHVSTIVVDHDANTTKITPASGISNTLNGIPRGVLYTNGAVNELTGPGRTGGVSPPAIARAQQLTIVATQDVIIQKDLVYEDFDNGQNVLGIFSSGGNIRIGSSAPDDLRVDAYVLASAAGRVFTVDGYNSGSYRGDVHLRGGMVTNHYGAFGTWNGTDMTGYGRDFRYDRRGLKPPYYPLTARFVADQPLPQILAWREVTE